MGRFEQLCASVPKGSFYQKSGLVIPHQTIPTVILMDTGNPSTEYGVTVAQTDIGKFTTDSNGILTISYVFPKGDNEIVATKSGTTEYVKYIVSSLDYATLFMSLANEYQVLDTDIQKIYDDGHIEDASISTLNAIFARQINLGTLSSFDTETFRECLIEARNAYRYYGSTKEGISRIVNAIYGADPWTINFDQGKRWILGADYVTPANDMARFPATIINPLPPADPFPNANASGANVTYHDGNYNRQATGGANTFTLNFTLTPGVSITANITSAGTVPFPDVTIDSFRPGIYRLYLPHVPPIVRSCGNVAGFDIVALINDYLHLDIDDKGLISIPLTVGVGRTPLQIATDINNALNGDARYGAAYAAFAVDHGGYFTLNDSMIATRILICDPPMGPGFAAAIRSNAAQTLFNVPVVRVGLNTVFLPCGPGTGILWLHDSPLSDYTILPEFAMSAFNGNNYRAIIGKYKYTKAGTTISANTTKSTPEIINISSMALPVGPTPGYIAIYPGVSYAHFDADCIEIINQMPYEFKHQELGWIDINITRPDWLVTTSDTFVLRGPQAPAGVVHDSSAPAGVANTIDPNFNYFDIDVDRCISSELVFDTSTFRVKLDKKILDYVGRYAQVEIWLSGAELADMPSPHTFVLNYYDDAECTLLHGPIGMGIPTNGSGRDNSNIGVPTHFISEQIPITKNMVDPIIEFTNCNRLYIHKIRVNITPFKNPGLGYVFTAPIETRGGSLGGGTIPRNQHRAKRGVTAYVTRLGAVTDDDKIALGLSNSGTNHYATNGTGQIDYVQPAHMWLERFEMAGSTTSVYGDYTFAQLSALTSYNLQPIQRTPDRLSYLRPILVSATTQQLTWSSGPVFTAPLLRESDQDVLTTFITEDDVPIPNDLWQYNSALQVQLLYTPDTAKTYIIHYQLLTQVISSDIDATASIYFKLHLNASMYIRPETNIIETEHQELIVFDSNGEAKLTNYSIIDKSKVEIIRQTVDTNLIIPQIDFDFVNNQIIRMNTSYIIDGAVYSIRYYSERNYPIDSVDYDVYYKNTSIQADLAGATWKRLDSKNVANPFTPDPSIPLVPQPGWFKLRVDIHNIKDVRDVKLKALLVQTFSNTTPV